MSISFHCEYCNKTIEAPDDAGGKWGKCPSCHNKLYVPGQEPGEELKLAPIDETEEEKKKRLMAETFELTQDILLEREVPDENDEPHTGIPATFHLTDRELLQSIIVYLRRMADGRLEEAQGTEELIISCGDRSVKTLDEIALSEIPEPQLADIPSQVLAGLIRNLRAKII
ncbi:MAG: hypothetical protein ACYS1A_04410 [Planctomycetota bacterium]|jgi:hypothetical protein